MPRDFFGLWPRPNRPARSDGRGDRGWLPFAIPQIEVPGSVGENRLSVIRGYTDRIQDGVLVVLGAQGACWAIVPPAGHAILLLASGVGWPRPWAQRANLSPDPACLQALVPVVARWVPVSAQQVHLW